MDVIRRNTDYALRFMLNLTRRFGEGPVSSRVLSAEEAVSYQLTCKLMQELKASGLVESRMGPKGGFFLAKKPSKISLADAVQAIQGAISVNGCLLSSDFCPKQPACPIGRELKELQEYIERFLSGVTLDELLDGGESDGKGIIKTLKKRVG